MKIKDNYKSYILLFLAGVLAGIICRLSDFFPYESLWSLSSIATMFGFWIASVGVITCFSSSNRGAFINSFLYMFGMTLSFYGLKSILGLYIERFSNESHFQTNLFLLYSALSVVCGIGSYILYYWNNGKLIGSILCALPASGMLAEAVACLLMLLNHRMLLAQTLFDFVFVVIFLFLLYEKANYKTIYFATMGVVTILVFLVVYQPFLF